MRTRLVFADLNVFFNFDNNEVKKIGEACINLVKFDTFLSRRLLSVTTQTARLEMDERQRMVENLFAELDMHAMNFQTPTSMVVKQMMHDVPTACRSNVKPFKKGEHHV